MPPLVFGYIKMQGIFQMGWLEREFMAYRGYAGPCFMTEFYGTRRYQKNMYGFRVDWK